MCNFIQNCLVLLKLVVYSEAASLITQVQVRSAYILPSLDHTLQVGYTSYIWFGFNFFVDVVSTQW